MRQLGIAAALAFGLSGSASADTIGIVVVGGNRAPIASAIAGAAGTGHRLVDDAAIEARIAIMGGAVPAARLEAFRRVRDEIEEAWRAYLRVQAELAASRLASARTDAETIVALPGGELLYADASLRLGAVLAHLGRAAEAQASLALALALDPDRPITLAEFSPDVVSAVDAARAQKRASRQVRIASEPAGAILLVDGKELGRAPLTAELALGQHVVVARLPLYEARGQAVAVDEATQQLAIELERDPAWRRLGEGPVIGLAETAAQELVDAIERYADLDEVLLAADSEQSGGPALLVQRCAGLPARCTAIVEIGYADRSGLPAAAREAWQAARAGELRYQPSLFADARVGGKPIDQGCKVCRNPFVWAGVGAVVVIGTIVAIAVASASRPPPIVGVDPGQF